MPFVLLRNITYAVFVGDEAKVALSHHGIGLWPFDVVGKTRKGSHVHYANAHDEHDAGEHRLVVS
ncbi:MAG: hypothetical protein RI933_696 [Actinomycetota bacterium]|jgi:hypothetical protein